MRRLTAENVTYIYQGKVSEGGSSERSFLYL